MPPTSSSVSQADRPLHVSPLPGEAFDSWWSRLASTYAVNPKELAQALAPSDQEHATLLQPTDLLPDPQPLMRELAEQTGISQSLLAPLFLPSCYPLHLSSQQLSHSAAARPTSFRAHRLWVLPRRASAYCPQCLATDAIPYFRKAWRLRITTLCPVHGQPMRETCPHCETLTGRLDSEAGEGSIRLCQVCGEDLCTATRGKSKDHQATSRFLIDAVLLENLTVRGGDLGRPMAVNNWDFAGAFADWLETECIALINGFVVSGRPLPARISWEKASLAHRSAFVQSFHHFISLYGCEREQVVERLPHEAQAAYQRCMEIHASIGQHFTFGSQPWEGWSRPSYKPDYASYFTSIGRHVSLEGTETETHLVYAAWHTDVLQGTQCHIGTAGTLTEAIAICVDDHCAHCGRKEIPEPEFHRAPINIWIHRCPRCSSLYSITASDVPLTKPQLHFRGEA